jgi:O-acetyl-ADP-ribose deacetylase (regulator of RNase III)
VSESAQRGPRLRFRLGDLTAADVDAVVNAANERMLGGGGVDGAIHRAAGPELLEACRAVPEVRPGVRCPTGEARITPGFRLPARFVLHTVGPVYRGRPADAELLARAHRSCLELAEEHGLRSLAFPAISCGVYGFPPEAAAPIAIGVIREREWAIDDVLFVLFTDDLLRVFSEAAASTA